MKRGKSDSAAVWIALADLLLAILAVVIVAVNPVSSKGKADIQGLYMITATWSVKSDSDVDLHMKTPAGLVYYAKKQLGCSTLDLDNRGFVSSHPTLADGTTSILKESKEMIQIRCIESGRYDVAAALFTGDSPVDVHVEVTSLKDGALLSQRDVTLKQVRDVINTMSFNIDEQGNLTLTSPPIQPID